MSLFSRLFGGSALTSNHAGVEVRPRQFVDNTSISDYARWFADAPGWKDLDRRLINVLIERLYGNPMFEVFVHASYVSERANAATEERLKSGHCR
jgi:hypothetical protein